MKKSKTFVELTKKMEVLSENAKGQLKGGFTVLSGGGGSANLDVNLGCNFGCTNNCQEQGCTNNNCDCTNASKTCRDKNTGSCPIVAG